MELRLQIRELLLSSMILFIAGHFSAVEHGSRLRLPGDLREAVRERRQPGGPRHGGQGAQEAERRHQERGEFAELKYFQGILI